MHAVEVRFPESAVAIDAYGSDGFRLNGETYRGSVAVLPDRVLAWDGLGNFSVFVEHAAAFDVLLVGVGAELGHASGAVLRERARLEAAGVGVEMMTTPSACRTYNVLLSEGRRVAAALVPVGQD